MKKYLIVKLFEQFDKDKGNIANNLLKVMDSVTLSAKNDDEELTMTIIYKRGVKNDTIRKSS